MTPDTDYSGDSRETLIEALREADAELERLRIQHTNDVALARALLAKLDRRHAAEAERGEMSVDGDGGNYPENGLPPDAWGGGFAENH